MPQLNAGEDFTDVTPGKTVTSTRLNNHVHGAALLNGAVIDQNDVSTRGGNVLPIAADMLLLGDSTQADSAVPLKVRLDQLLLQSQRDGTQRWGGTAGGTANALTLATSPVSSGAYVSGETVRFKTGAAANTGAVTVNLDGRGVVNLYSNAIAALVAGDLPANAVVEAVYDGTEFQLMTVALTAKQIDSLRVAEKLRGDCQQYVLATGTNTIAVAPLDSSGAATFTALYTGMVVAFKAANSITGAATLGVNGLGGVAIKRIVAGAVADLVANDIQAGDLVTARYDGTNFLMTGKVRSWDFVSAGTTAQPGVSAAATIAHGLGAIPTKLRVVLVLTSAVNNGYAVGDEVEAPGILNNGNSNCGLAVCADATNVTVAQTSNGTLQCIPKGGGAPAAISANWKIKVYASL